MSQKALVRKVSTDISLECWKKLKKLSIDKELTLSQTIKEILERGMGKKHFEEIVVNE